MLTTAVPLARLFLSPNELESALAKSSEADKTSKEDASDSGKTPDPDEPDFNIDSAARMMMDDLGLNMQIMQKSGLFSGDEERFAFTRALSRLSEMGSKEWVERGMGGEADEALERRVRSKWREDKM